MAAERLKRLGGVLKQAGAQWARDGATRQSAALAFYAMFSLAPLLLLAVMIAGAVFGREAARGEITQQITSYVGPQAAQLVGTALGNVSRSGGTALATIVGIAGLAFSATGVLTALQDTFNRAWQVRRKSGKHIRGFLRRRALAALIVMVAAVLLLASLVASTALAALRGHLPAMIDGYYIWQAADVLISLGLTSVLFAAVYKILPDAQVRWRDVWVGAIATAVLFTGGRYLLTLYLAFSSVSSVYGAAGSLVALLLWVYLSGMLVIFGAEFTQAWAQHHGRDVAPAAHAERVRTAPASQDGRPPCPEPAMPGTEQPPPARPPGSWRRWVLLALAAALAASVAARARRRGHAGRRV